jgi:hypothetical protein
VPPKNHIHKYQRAKLGSKYIIYKCTLPDCSHFIRKELVPGRRSICWYCNEPFILTKASLRLKSPNCGCRKSNRVKGSTLEEMITELGVTIE